MSKNVVLGNTLRERRHALGWDAKDAAYLYSKFIRPIKPETIWKIEEGAVPDNLKRRLVLAGMFGLAPSVLNIPPLKKDQYPPINRPLKKPKHVNLEEYQATLLKYYTQGYTDPKEAIADIHARIQALHSKVLYVPEKEQMKRLLCGYQVRLANVLREQGYDKATLYHMNNAIILAREEHLTEFEAASLYRRGEHYFDRGELKKAVRDFSAALQLHPPSQVEGKIKVVLGVTQARLALTETDRTQAWKLANSAQNLAGKYSGEELYLVGMSMARYFLEQAKTYMGSSVKKFRSPIAAEEAIKEAEKYTHPDKKNFYSYLRLETDLVMAQIEKDQGYLPLATNTALEAIEKMMRMHNNAIHLPLMTAIYNDLSESSYGTSLDVAELGIRLMFLQFAGAIN